MARIVVDPVTRIEGHLRIEATVENGVITDAYSAGTMVRGFEKILKGRDPRDAWAFTERACGVCTTVHALASVRTVEDALDISVPENAELIRNLMFCAQYVQDHVVHFYHLHALDWVDVVSALSADPNETSRIARSISRWPKTSPAYFSDLQKRLKGFVDSGQLGIFANAYWGHPAYKLPPEVNLIGVAHYLEALAINLDEVNSINTERLNQVGKLIKDAMVIVEQLYYADVMAVAPFYTDWASIGGGLENYMSYGDLPTRGYNQPDFFKFPRGVILGRDLNEVHEVDGTDVEQIKEYIARSWYSYAGGDEEGLHPWDGETELNYTGPRPPYEHLDVDAKYSWLKTPRWRDKPMEVGPLARMLVGFASGRTEIQDVVTEALERLQVPVGALFSTLGRTAARCLETRLVARWMQEFYDQLVTNVAAGRVNTFTRERWEPSTWPEECQGVGLSEAPRGALAHWIRIKDRKIDNYQLVVPTTWNGSPRDPNGGRSAFEASLLGTPVANLEQPLEILRTVHSFDPCVACAVHLYDPEGKHLHQVSFQ